MSNELLTCPWCGEQMRFDADSVHVWYKCDNCFAISPKARRLWDDSKTNQENWNENKNRALFLIERSNAKSSRWISVEERLPENYISVIGYLPIDDKEGLPPTREVYHTEKGWFAPSLGELCIVAHWMSMPEGFREV